VPRSFGLGGAEPAVLDAACHRLGGPAAVDLSSSPLLPSKAREKLRDRAAEGSGAAERGGSAGGEGGAGAADGGPGSGLGSESDASDGTAARDDPAGGAGSDGAVRSSGRQQGASPAGWKVLSVGQRSKLEAQQLEASKARHHERVRHTREQQHAAGGQHSGADGAAGADSSQEATGRQPFIANPPHVVFADIVPGAPQRAEVVLVNAGPVKASIRLVDVEGEVGGTASGGGTCRLRGLRDGAGEHAAFVALQAMQLLHPTAAEWALSGRCPAHSTVIPTAPQTKQNQLSDVLEAVMPPPGFVAPGGCCVLSLSLTPREEGDAAGAVRLLTPLGTLALPVRCAARRALPALDAPGGVLEVGPRGAGGMMVAARAERSVRITNGGALAVEYEIKVGAADLLGCMAAWGGFKAGLCAVVGAWCQSRILAAEAALRWARAGLPPLRLAPHHSLRPLRPNPQKVEGPLAASAETVHDAGDCPGDSGADGSWPSSPPPDPRSSAEGGRGAAAASRGGTISVAGFAVRAARGVVPGYGEAAFSVEFAPLVPGRVEVPLSVAFCACENRALPVPGAALLLTAVGRDLPVSAEREVLDFRWEGVEGGCVLLGAAQTTWLHPQS
jgi:hypothetical protein